jgi:hypothetical protein
MCEKKMGQKTRKDKQLKFYKTRALLCLMLTWTLKRNG